MGKVKISITIDEELLHQLEEHLGSVNRSTNIEQAVRDGLLSYQRSESNLNYQLIQDIVKNSLQSEVEVLNSRFSSLQSRFLELSGTLFFMRVLLMTKLGFINQNNYKLTMDNVKEQGMIFIEKSAKDSDMLILDTLKRGETSE